MVSLPFDLCTTRDTPSLRSRSSIRPRRVFVHDAYVTASKPIANPLLPLRNQNRFKFRITILSLSLSFEKKTIVTKKRVGSSIALSLSLSLNLIYVFHLEYLVEHRLPSWLINLVDERLEGWLPRKQARRDTALGIGCDHALAKTRPRFHRPRTSDLVT